jgi:hypothetical protein
VGYLVELMTINEQVQESIWPLLRLSREIIRIAPPEWVTVSNKNPGFSINESKNEPRNIAFRLWRS